MVKKNQTSKCIGKFVTIPQSLVGHLRIAEQKMKHQHLDSLLTQSKFKTQKACNAAGTPYVSTSFQVSVLSTRQ